MTCEQCQELISLFLDGELDSSNSATVQTHLALCAACAKVCEDFAVILDFCVFDDEAANCSLPPNSNALWRRISNTIESEIESETKCAAPLVQAEIKKGFFARSKNGSLRFSVSQIFSAALGIALLSSLLTVVGFKNYTAQQTDFASNAAEERSVFQKVLGKVGLVETPEEARERRLREQEAAIDYWNRRVEARRPNWDAHLRQAFDRNLNEINQAAFEYHKILQENPQDELSSEMLDTTLNDKLELLREFSDL
jgi:hypothetical protein